MKRVRFDELGLNQYILKAVKEMGFETASPIQAAAIPVVMSGKDVIGQAQTGTGKTAAFGIPLLEKIDPGDKKLQAIVLCPTRELAIQVADEIRRLSKFMQGIKVLPIYGGEDIGKQIRSLRSGIQLIIGTPGRVMDHMRRHTLKLEKLHTIVLDEADEMLNMGFREDIETILKDTPEEHQTILFSATMPKPILDITKNFQKDAQYVKVTKKELTVKNINQYYYDVKSKTKEEVLSRLLEMHHSKLSLVFCNTKRRVDELTNALKVRGFFAEGLHGDMKQFQRDRVMNRFRRGMTDILIATDVAARGIDVDNVEAVYNYDIPQDDEFYVHRIGRTGRAGRIGKAFSLVEGKEVYKLKDIQRYCKTKIYPQPVPSIDDVNAIKSDKILNSLTETIHNENLSEFMVLIEHRLAGENYTALELAAAFLQQAIGFENREEQKRIEAAFENTGAENGMVRLFVNIGKKQNIRPGDILGAIVGESGISGNLIGNIDMHDKYSFVEVPRENAFDVIKAMENVKIRGKHINMEPANQKH